MLVGKIPSDLVSSPSKHFTVNMLRTTQTCILSRQRLFFLRLILSLYFLGPWYSALADEPDYPEHPDSVVKENVPKGELLGPFQWTSKIFPGTVRDYQLYIPKQYDATKPACVFIVQDGIGRALEWKLPVVMDNLIADGSMPVTIGIFVDPGVVPAANTNAQPRFNRSFEYDGLGDRYARFLIDELLPEVSKSYSLSSDPNDRAIAGASSGAICAFNAAWERPDQFRRVISTIGTFVGLRGANEFPVLVRKTEPKPIRIFLQDGATDLDIYAGNWFVANQDMLSSFEYAGYDVKNIWGTGGHNGKQARAIMPDAMRWLWRDYPAPITAKMHRRGRIQILTDSDQWELVSEGHQFTEGPAVSPNGDLYFVDAAKDTIFHVPHDGKAVVFQSDVPGVSGLMFGPDKKLYAAAGKAKRIFRYDEQGNRETVLEDVSCNDLVVLPSGIYYTDPANHKVWFATFDGTKKEVDTGISYPNGLICSIDQTLLHVADSDGSFTFSFQIQPDGGLAFKQPYGYLHAPDGTGKSSADGMTMDKDGNLYVATTLGVQVLDQPGRVNLIINKPQAAFLSNVAFAGPERDWLYVTCGDKVYRRKTQTRGNISWEPPTMPPKPGL